MKIVILGAGRVGSTLAETLAGEDHDLVVVDSRPERLAALRERVDVRSLAGHASYPDVLRRAGTDDADMIIAVTGSDETNILACRIAQTLFHTPTKIARLRAANYLAESDKLFLPDALAVDMLISPEALITESIQRLIEYPGALQVVDFAEGRVRLVGVKAFYGGPLVGHPLKTLPTYLGPGVDARIAAIYRRGRAIAPTGDTLIESEDEVYFVAATEHIHAVMAQLRKPERPVRRLMLAGGGNIGVRLATALQNRLQVKIIERQRERATTLSQILDHVVVLCGDAANESLLREENIEDCDVFCAITNDDEANVLSSMLAKRLGARRALALVNRIAYVDLIEGGAIDVAISPQQATVSALLAHVRRGDLVKVHSLRRGAAEAIEAVAHGDQRSSRVVGRCLDDIKLPPGASISAVIRGTQVLIAHKQVLVESGDHIIIFIVDKRGAREVEKLFQVSVTFI